MRLKNVLGWIDDVITVPKSAHKTARMNSFINVQLATKKLRLGAKKCNLMHVATNVTTIKILNFALTDGL